ncbi:hypothetical protein LV779_26175 [Streptomyces thinghirensis]|nr:hypothetical protein [Streptomyces thinghirensis]
MNCLLDPRRGSPDRHSPQPGLRAPERRGAPRRARVHRPLPQSYEWATIWCSRRDPLQRPGLPGYGRARRDGLWAPPSPPPGGHLLDTGRAPRSAAGPDLRQLVLGSEGAFGVITSGHRAGEARAEGLPLLRAGASPSFDEGAAPRAGSPRTARARRCCGSPTRRRH